LKLPGCQAAFFAIAASAHVIPSHNATFLILLTLPDRGKRGEWPFFAFDDATPLEMNATDL
jgi:hypothetical protein